mmetsp:Transcript_48058/g.116755  ORF Transcript_48058/g.116755 Transcript_48058/m.116755 type:complete len:284 (-) Transcript_48058:89-940(-)
MPNSHPPHLSEPLSQDGGRLGRVHHPAVLQRHPVVRVALLNEGAWARCVIPQVTRYGVANHLEDHVLGRDSSESALVFLKVAPLKPQPAVVEHRDGCGILTPASLQMAPLHVDLAVILDIDTVPRALLDPPQERVLHGHLALAPAPKNRPSRAAHTTCVDGPLPSFKDDCAARLLNHLHICNKAFAALLHPKCTRQDRPGCPSDVYLLPHLQEVVPPVLSWVHVDDGPLSSSPLVYRFLEVSKVSRYSHRPPRPHSSARWQAPRGRDSTPHRHVQHSDREGKD